MGLRRVALSRLTAGFVITVFILGDLPLLAARAPVATNRVKEELNIYEAVFRYRIERAHYPHYPFFLSIRDSDPSDEFLARFAQLTTPVKKASEGHYVKEPYPGHISDKITGESGVNLSAEQVIWLSSRTVEVKGGSYCGGRWGDWGVTVCAR